MKIYEAIKIKEVFSPYYMEKISPSLSYKIYKLCKSIEQEEQFFNAKREELIRTYAEKDATGEIVVDEKGNVKIIDEKIDVAQQELNELSAIEIELPNINFKLSELTEIKLSVMDMVIIDSLVKEESIDI